MSTEIRRAVARGCVLIGCFLFAAVIFMASAGRYHGPVLAVTTCLSAAGAVLGGWAYLRSTGRRS